jgi:hypothetical protein
MRRWVLYLSLLVMGLILGVQYYWALPGKADGGLQSLVYSYVVPALFVLFAIWLGYRMFTYKNRTGVMVGASLVLGFLFVAGLFTGFAHNGSKEYRENVLKLNEAQKAVQNAVNNWDAQKNGPIKVDANGLIDYHAMGFAGCPPINESNPKCAYQFKLVGDKKVEFVNRAQFEIEDPVLGNIGIFEIIGWLALAVAMSANLFLLLESFVGVEMPVDLIYEEGVEAR